MPKVDVLIIFMSTSYRNLFGNEWPFECKIDVFVPRTFIPRKCHSCVVPTTKAIFVTHPSSQNVAFRCQRRSKISIWQVPISIETVHIQFRVCQARQGKSILNIVEKSKPMAWIFHFVSTPKRKSIFIGQTTIPSCNDITGGCFEECLLVEPSEKKHSRTKCQ